VVQVVTRFDRLAYFTSAGWLPGPSSLLIAL